MMRKLRFSSLFRYKPWMLTVLFVVLAVFVPNITYAGWPPAATWVWNNLVLFIFGSIVSFFGVLLLGLLWILVQIGSYNSFLDARAVVIGWAVVRDVVNIGFIIGLLIIAFGTVLRIQTYHYKNTLIKLLIMALLVNFSKIITGVFIDLSQVVMLTFFHAVEDSVGVFIIAFGPAQWFTNSTNGVATQTNVGEGVFWSTIMALFMAVLACVVVLIMIVMLLWRILMLWILVIFSPVAYVAQAIPSLKSYGDKWWQTLSKYLVNGPVMAFLLWLALSIIAFNYTENQANPEAAQPIISSVTSDLDAGAAGETVGAPPGAGTSQAAQPVSVFDFITAMALFVMAISLAASAGIMGASFAGSALNTIRAVGTGVVAAPFKAAKLGATVAGEKLYEKGVINLLPSQWKQAWKESRELAREKRLSAGLAAGREALEKKGGARAWMQSPLDFLENHVNSKLFTPSGMKRFTRMLRGKDVQDRKDIIAKKDKLAKEEEHWNKEKEEVGKRLGLTDDQRRAREDADQLEKQAADLDAMPNEDKEMKKMIASGTIDLKGHPEFRVQLLAEMKHQQAIMKDTTRSKADQKAAARRLATLQGVHDQIETGATSIALKGKFKDAQNIMAASKADTRKTALKNEVNRLRTIASEDKVKEYHKKTKEYDEELASVKEKREHLNDELVKLGPSEMFYARGAFRSLIDEEGKKISHVKESEELIAMLKQAIEHGEQARAAAIAHKLTKDYNENDMLNAFGYNSSSINDLHAFFQEKIIGGRRVQRTDGKYDTNQDGTLKWEHDATMKGAGMSEQAALSLEQDLGYIAEDNNHQVMSRGVGYRNGRLVQRSENQQSDAIVNEMEKQDIENLFRRMNRLGVGGETPDGKFQLGMVGAKLFMRNWRALEQTVLQRKNANRVLIANLTSPQSLKMLRGLADTLVPPSERSEFEKIMKGMVDLSKERQREKVAETKSAVEDLFRRAA